MLGRIARGASRRMGALDTRIRHHIKQARRRLVALDETRILNTVKTFGAFNSNILLVHSSLSACGHINGGAGTVVEALRGWIRDRTLAMPTHTYCYPDSRGTVPIFEVCLTPRALELLYSSESRPSSPGTTPTCNRPTGRSNRIYFK